eukprot:1188930-Prorocentrum_minimum.AAC.1
MIRLMRSTLELNKFHMILWAAGAVPSFGQYCGVLYIFYECGLWGSDLVDIINSIIDGPAEWILLTVSLTERTDPSSSVDSERREPPCLNALPTAFAKPKSVTSPVLKYWSGCTASPGAPITSCDDQWNESARGIFHKLTNRTSPRGADTRFRARRCVAS